MGLVGVYSFPKSGNTWVRVVLGNIMKKNAASIPDLHAQKLSEAATFNGFRFFKHHGGKNLKVWQQQKLDTTQVIHIRRNPLDVFVSYLNFVSDNVTGTASIKFTSVDDIKGTDLLDIYLDTFIATGQLSIGFAHITGGYFDHNRYWTTQSEVPAICLRYEDMLADAQSALEPVRDLLKIDEAALVTALSRTAAATKPNGKFFWKQQEKNYLNYLTEKQIERFLRFRAEDCRAIGYDPESIYKPS